MTTGHVNEQRHEPGSPCARVTWAWPWDSEETRRPSSPCVGCCLGETVLIFQNLFFSNGTDKQEFWTTLLKVYFFFFNLV